MWKKSEEYKSETSTNQFLFIIGNLLFFMAVTQSILSRDFTFDLGVITTLWIIVDFCILTKLIDVGIVD
jgi:hypothetical protein